MSVELVQDIFRAAYFLDNEHFESVSSKFLENFKTVKLKSFKKDYVDCGFSYLKRVELFQKYFEWLPIQEKYFDRFQKSAEYSAAFREVGNRAYKAKDISHAFRGYNLALAFAPSGTEQEGLAYANRSALFVFINEFDKALVDLKLALTFNMNETIVEKLLTRKMKCEEEVKFDQDGFFGQEGKTFCEQKFLNLKSKNMEIKGAEEFVKIVFSPECGRRLVATKDIAAGTPVVVDKGYVKILDKLLNWDTEHCASCTKPILGGIPNPSTSFGLYCHEECLNQALNSVSKYEHNYLPYIHCTQHFHDESLLILRSLIKVGPNELYKLWKEPFLENTPEGTIAGFNSEGVFDPESYLSVYNLVAHRSALDFNNLNRSKEFKSIFLTNVLDQSTPFFEGKSDPDFKLFITSLFLKHFENLDYNVLSLCEWRTISGPLSQPLWNEEAKRKSQTAKTSSYATGVFPLVALCNHSCDPNAVFVKGTKVDSSSVVTSRFVKAGDEILISYKAPFTRMGFEERQKYLEVNYKFKCECGACVRKYSIKDTVEEPRVVCDCWDKVMGNKCAECEMKLSRLMEVGMKLELVQKYLREEKFTRAYPVLVEQADFLSNFYINFKPVQICQDLFRRVVIHIMHL